LKLDGYKLANYGKYKKVNKWMKPFDYLERYQLSPTP